MNGKTCLKMYIITPVVMAGADRSKPELREQSIKGILRWWWRFYEGALMNIKSLKEKEEEIFGSQDLASRVRIRLENHDNLNITDAYLRMNDDSRKVVRRKAFDVGQYFNLNLEFLDTYKQEIENTLWLLSNLGGIGARWRRGFGSVMREEDMKLDIESIVKELRKFKQNSQDKTGNCGFMHLGNTDIFILSGNWYSWKDAMNDLRDDFYRALKNIWGIRAIAIGNPRSVSPLIIQIKKFKGKFYGVILICKSWDKYDEMVKFINQNRRFKVWQV